MAGNSLGPSIMEAEDSQPLDIMDPLVAEDFQVTLRCSGMLMSVEQVELFILLFGGNIVELFIFV